MPDTVTPAVGNELFLHNMRALWRVDPTLALRVDAVDDHKRLPLEPTRSGAYTARVPTDDGGTVYLHSRYDPDEEARRLIDTVNLDDKFCILVSGLGLGYHVRALADRLRGDAFIICTEPALPVIATCLTCVDLADIIAARRLVILTDADKARLHERLKPHSATIMLGVAFLRHPASIRAAGPALTHIGDMIREFVDFTRMSLMTLIGNARITCRNIAMNLPTYLTTPPIDILRDRFTGDPAVVISAGPSLARNIDRLADLKGNAVLCAVQTTLKPLLQRGIVPDFVTSLDFHEISRQFFQDVGDLSTVHLVAEPKATWHVLDHYPGPISVVGSDWARLLLGDELGGRGTLRAGATVAHLAFYLAVYMGCDPIIFVGQDLAFTGHVFYTPGVEVHHAWRSEINRFHTMETKEWERIVRNRPILRRVDGTGGTSLYTDELLFTYLEQFEKDIAATSATVINATEGGARIRGTESVPLKQVADQYCTRAIAPQRFAYRTTTRWRDTSRLERAREELKRRVDELDAVAELCEEMLGLLDELKQLTHDPARFNRRLVRVDELRTRVRQSGRAYGIISHAMQLAEFRRFSADTKLDASRTDDVERAQHQLRRDTDFVTAVRDGATAVKSMLLSAIDRIHAAEQNATKRA